METSSALLAHLCGEFIGHRWIPRTRASDAELCISFDLRLNKRLSKQSWGWWFETSSCSLWGHCNVFMICHDWLIVFVCVLLIDCLCNFGNGLGTSTDNNKGKLQRKKWIYHHVETVYKNIWKLNGANWAYCSITICALFVNTLRPRQNGRHFPDDIFKWIFLNQNVWISINISLKFVPSGPINNIPTWVQVMAWCRPGDKPLSEAMVVRLPTHICVTRPQWQYSNICAYYVRSPDTIPPPTNTVTDIVGSP